MAGSEDDDLDTLPPEYSASSSPNAVAVAVPVEEKRVWIAPPPAAPNATLLRLSCPRLFLVLPVDGHPLDELAPHQNKFTVHFLCYGGDPVQVKVPGCNNPDTVPGHLHLCGHKGYELERPIEFFDQYGPDILNILQMLQHGFPVQGKTAPSLKELDYARVSRESRDGIEYMPRVRLDLEQSILQMISYLQMIQKGDQKSFEEHVRAGDLDPMDETTDLSDIRSYFKDLHSSEKNEDQSLGYLVRGCMEGSNKEVWLCHPHYDAIFDTKAAKELRAAVNWDKGFYEYKDKRLTLILRMSKTTVFHNYSDLIGGAKNARELDLTIDCDPTMVELEYLGNIIALKTLRKITINLRNYTRPTNGLFNRGRRTDPFVHILFASPELEVAHFKEIEGFFSKSAPFSEHRQTRLQEIHIDSLFDPRAHSEKLVVLFKQCPQLKTLSLACPKGDRFIETIELVKELLLDHKYFQHLNVTCPNFKATFDRAEPESALLDRILPPTPGTRAGVTILQRYWRDLETIILDNDFCDAEINALTKLLPKQFTKLQRFNIARNLVFLSADHTTGAGQSKLLDAIRRMSPYPQGLVEGPSPSLSQPEESNGKEVAMPPVRSLSSSTGMSSSSVQSPPLCEISLQMKYPQNNHRKLAAVLFPYVIRFELEAPYLNKVIPRIYKGMSSSRPSLIRSFHFLGAYFSVKDTTISDLIQILKLCPGLETLRMTRMKFKTEQWERVLGCLDYSRLRTLEFPHTSLNRTSRSFPVEVLPADAILEELNLYDSYLFEEQNTALLTAMKKQLPDCKVILQKELPPKSLLHIS